MPSSMKALSAPIHFRFTLGLVVFVCLAFSAVAYIVEWDAEGVDHLTRRRKLEGPKLEHHDDVGDALDEYMAKGMPDIIGWLEFQALLVIRVISSYQIDQGVQGGVAEIGVHHGKFFAALCLLNSDAGEEAGVAIAIDVFEVRLAYFEAAFQR